MCRPRTLQASVLARFRDFQSLCPMAPIFATNVAPARCCESLFSRRDLFPGWQESSGEEACAPTCWAAMKRVARRSVRLSVLRLRRAFCAHLTSPFRSTCRIWWSLPVVRRARTDGAKVADRTVPLGAVLKAEYELSDGHVRKQDSAPSEWAEEMVEMGVDHGFGFESEAGSVAADWSPLCRTMLGS